MSVGFAAMQAPRHHISAELTTGFARIRADLGVRDEFSDDALELATARAAAASTSGSPSPHVDRRDIPLLSIDPPGSRDLDQALHLERNGSGYRFHYAIADVANWVEPGDPIDAEARLRGTTIYAPDRRVPLHPTALSEGAASLLQGVDRPALLWTIDLDQRGEVGNVSVERAMVHNRRALSYGEVQTALDSGSTDEQFRLIDDVGRLRVELETARGGVSLELPEQTVDRVDDHYELTYDAALDVEHWNAQLSLCCGMAAAQLMLGAKVGILRTLPPADPDTIARLRVHSTALHVAWPADMDYPTWVRTLDPSTPAGAALMTQAARTLRGSGYLAFDGDVPTEHRHHAIAADYAHVTAPLRRLVDRFANECVLAAASGTRPPAWVLEALDELPGIMGSTARLANEVDRAVVDLAEAAVLAHRVGDTFSAVITSAGRGFSSIQLTEPAVIGTIAGELAIGTTITVRLEAADLAGPTVRFSRVEEQAEPATEPRRH